MEIVGGVQGRRGYYALQKWSRGVILRPAENPDGILFQRDVLDGILLDASAPKITPECWTAMIQLFIHCVEQDPRKQATSADANNEVCVVFAYRYSDNHVIVAAMPQVVGHSRVSMDRTKGAVNLITGEKYTYWPPEGYGEIGDCHSHNTFGAFFSGTDDNDDKGLPGVHLVCGSFKRENERWTYKIATSVVADGERFKKVILFDEASSTPFTVRTMEYTDIAEIAWVEDVTLHSGVLDVVHVDYPKDWVHETPKQSALLQYGGLTKMELYEKYSEEEKTEWEKWRQQNAHYYADHASKGWKPTPPKHYTKEDCEFREKYGCWPDSPYADKAKAWHDKNNPSDDAPEEFPTLSQIMRYMGMEKQRDVKGQLSLYDEVKIDEPEILAEWWHDFLDEEFDNIDMALKYLREIMPDTMTFRTVMAEYFNRIGIFKGTVKPRKERTGE